MEYEYNISDTLNNKIASDALKLQIAQESGITIQIDYVSYDNDPAIQTPKVRIGFADTLPGTQKADHLDGIIAAHDGVELVAPSQYDGEGATLARIKVTKTGWFYQVREFEISLSKKDGCESFQDNVALTDFTCKIFDSNGNEITDVANEANAVRTQVIWSPNHDYEILGGKLHQVTTPTSNIRMAIYGGPVDAGVAYCKYFVPSINLARIAPNSPLDTDGRASKLMYQTTAGVPVPTNKFCMNFYYPQGSTHDFAVIFEIFNP